MADILSYFGKDVLTFQHGVGWKISGLSIFLVRSLELMVVISVGLVDFWIG